jgi:hypothetical protein
MKSLLWLLLLVPPAPVLSIGAQINADQSFTIHWILPADPTVIGVTIIRERLDFFEPTVVFTLAAVSDYTDATGLLDADYRYWVYTRNAGGELSTGAFVDLIGFQDHAHSTTAFWCFGGASVPSSTWPLWLGAALAILALAVPRHA